MKRISFITLGCKLNYAETSTYERAAVRSGFTVVPWTEKDVDVYVVNTCSVTEHSDKKSRNIIRKLHRTCPDARIFVTGCYAELKKKEVEALEGVTAVFGAHAKHLVAGALSACITDGSDADICPAATAEPLMFPAWSDGERTRSFLKVQDGCDFKCNYCTVPYARGESRNIPIAEIIPQAEAVAASGIKEIVLTGVNTGDFGKSTGENFFQLVRALNGVDGIERYRISSIEPNLLTEEIVDWIASGTKFLPHFHIPLQSGSDAVLKEMGRRYTTSDFEHKINYIRRALERPGAAKVFFGIDVIVGFPGESDALFEETVAFLERIRPAFIHIFPYSRRPGTPAAVRKDQVQDSVKTERVERLEALCERLHGEFVEANRGVREKVLFESTDRNGMMSGYTGNYIQVTRPYDPALVGHIVDIVI